MDDPFQMVAGFPFVFVLGIKLIAGLVGGSTHDGAALHLPTGDDRDVKMGTRDVCLASFSFVVLVQCLLGVADAIGAGGRPC